VVRDAYTRDTLSPTYYTKTTVYHSDGRESVYERQTSAVHRRAAGWRGDLVKSDGVRPTRYKAFRFESIPHAYSYEKTTWRSGAHDIQRHAGYSQEGAIGHGSLEGYVDDVRFPNRLDNRAISAVINDARDSNVDIGQLLGEFPQTWSMMARNAISVLSAYRAVRRGNIGLALKHLGLSKQSLRKFPKAAADAWLTLKFGWLPMLQGVYDVSQLKSSDFRPKGFFEAKGYATEDMFMGTYPNVSGSHTKGVEIGIAYSVDDPFWANLNSLGLANPASLAWELLPMSFVIDWFLPIGRTFTALSNGVGLSFHHGYKTRFSRGSFEYGPDLPTGYSGIPQRFTVSVSGMSRTVLSTWPRPTMAIPSPLNQNQGTTLLALLAQRT